MIMNESDWKVFKKIKEKAIVKYCSRCFAEFKDVINDESKDIHERYLLNYRLVESRDKQMSVIFDGHSRSKAWLQLLAIRAEGLADESLLLKLSDEFRERTDPVRHIIE